MAITKHSFTLNITKGETIFDVKLITNINRNAPQAGAKGTPMNIEHRNVKGTGPRASLHPTYNECVNGNEEKGPKMMAITIGSVINSTNLDSRPNQS